MDNYISVSWETQAETPIILSIGNINLHDHTTTGTGVTNIGIHRQFQRTWVDAQDIL